MWMPASVTTTPTTIAATWCTTCRATRVVINRGRDRFFYSGGSWYAPRGGVYVVVGAPLGVFVPVLPPLLQHRLVRRGVAVPTTPMTPTTRGTARTMATRSSLRRPGLSTRPPDASPPPPPPAPATSQMFVYPKNGQSADLQSKDKYECHTWATGQTGFDPTVSGGGVSPDQLGPKTDAYKPRHHRLSAGPRLQRPVTALR